MDIEVKQGQTNDCRFCRQGKLLFDRFLLKEGNELWKCSKCMQYQKFRTPRNTAEQVSFENTTENERR